MAEDDEEMRLTFLYAHEAQAEVALLQVIVGNLPLGSFNLDMEHHTSHTATISYLCLSYFALIISTVLHQRRMLKKMKK